MSEDSMLAELGLDKNMCFKEEIRYISFHECLLINNNKKKTFKTQVKIAQTVKPQYTYLQMLHFLNMKYTCKHAFTSHMHWHALTS